jgi:hypothetical protein
VNKLKETSNNFKKNEWDNLKKEKSHVKAVHEAFKKRSSAILLIVVSRDAKTNILNIYYLTKQNPDYPITVPIKDKTLTDDIGGSWNALISELTKNEGCIKTKGEAFSTYLLNNEDILSVDSQNMGEVWVYCQNKFLEPLWEWLFWKNDFWGNLFHIVRIPETFMNNEGLKSKIEEVTILRAPSCLCAVADSQIIGASGVETKDKDISSAEDLQGLNGNGIHVVQDVTINVMRAAVDIAKTRQEPNSPILLFLNIFTSKKLSDTYDDREKWMKLFQAKMSIFTTLSVPIASVSDFTEIFYTRLAEKNNIFEAFKAAKSDSKTYLKFAYVALVDPTLFS